MSDTPNSSGLPELQGHTVGVFDSAAGCADATQALNEAGFADSDIYVFYGDEGIHALEEVMEVRLWGESSEHLTKQCLGELQDGHAVMSVKTDSADEAATVAAISTQFGGRNIYHFGLLVDTRLTK